MELIALGLQAALERLEVLDDAVVDDGQLTVATNMGVSVDVGRRAVRGPAGVADAGLARRRRTPPAGLQASIRPADLQTVRCPRE